MYKVTWGQKNDPLDTTLVILPSVVDLFDFYHVLTGYGRKDGCVPVNIKVTNLDGEEIDMSKGLPRVASLGT